MVDEAGAEAWSAVAVGWSGLWGGSARPAQDALIDASGIAAGTRVLDVGCGGGEFLLRLRDVGAEATGVDPAEGMRRLAVARGFPVYPGDAEHLSFPDGSFDVVTAVNALQFADDATAALAEFTRVLSPGGRIAIANWADSAENDLDTIEHAVAVADDTEPPADDPLRVPGGQESALAKAGLELTASGIVDTPWRAADDDMLVAGVLLGADPGFVAEMRPVVLAAAAPFQDGAGYLLRNRFRWAVGTRPGPVE